MQWFFIEANDSGLCDWPLERRMYIYRLDGTDFTPHAGPLPHYMPGAQNSVHSHIVDGALSPDGTHFLYHQWPRFHHYRRADLDSPWVFEQTYNANSAGHWYIAPNGDLYFMGGDSTNRIRRKRAIYDP